MENEDDELVDLIFKAVATLSCETRAKLFERVQVLDPHKLLNEPFPTNRFDFYG